MRATVGPIVLHLLLVLAGLGILRVSGVVPRLWSITALAAWGLAYLCGFSAVIVLSVTLLVLGGPFNLVTFVVFAVLLASPLLLDVRRGFPFASRPGNGWLSRRRRWWRQLDAETQLAAAILLVFAVAAIVGFFTLSRQPIDRGAYDAWNLWMRKANLMFFGSHLPTEIFKSPAEGYIQAYYPIGFPLLEAAHMRAVGLYETSTVHLLEWILLVAFVWAGAFLASRVTRPLVWATVLPGVMMLAYGQASSGYADVPVAIFLCLAVLTMGIWLERGGRGMLAVGCLLLAGGAQIKNEGIAGAVITLIVAAIYLARLRRWESLRDLGVGAALVVLLGIAPWHLYVAANHLPVDHPFSHTVNPVYLARHLDLVWPSLQALEAQIVATGTTVVFIILAVALSLARLRGPARLPIAGFYLGVGLLYFLSLLDAFWTTPFGGLKGLGFYLFTTVVRIVPAGLAFVAVAAILHLGEATNRVAGAAAGANESAR